MILVTGGAGYIGSQIVKDLLENNFKVIVIDNLELGHKKSIPAKNLTFFEADFADNSILEHIFSKFTVEAVMHIAAYSNVSESTKNPARYFKNNVEKSKKLLSSMGKAGIRKIIFSSSAAIYGEPNKIPIDENDPKIPINPYGESKLEFEKILSDSAFGGGIDFVSLRYFNAAGADPSGNIGEDHLPETHLIPRVLKTALGQFEKIEIFGSDYPTPDGTAIRDYVHIKDISSAHILALSALLKGSMSVFYNIGCGTGYSVKEVIEMAQKIVGKKINSFSSTRRSGDPAILITDNKKIKTELKWIPQYSDLETIISTAWEWHKAHPKGYK